MSEAVLQTGYFGKLPSRPDFIKGGAHHQAAVLLDRWVAETMNELAVNPRWKQHYDRCGPLDFAFVGTRSTHAIAGHLRPSWDQSQRRFPVVALTVHEAATGPRSLAEYPQLFEAFWEAAGTARDLAGLGAVSGTPRAPEAPPDLDTLEHMLACGGRRCSVRGIVLGIGLLLQPFRWSGAQRLDRSLVLPLPPGAAQQAAVAGFWLSLMAPFLRDLELELALLFARQGERPVLAVGFSGAAPAPLRAMLDPEFAQEHQITFDDTGWVDKMIREDAAVLRLAACLGQGSLSLDAARQQFGQAFD